MKNLVFTEEVTKELKNDNDVMIISDSVLYAITTKEHSEKYDLIEWYDTDESELEAYYILNPSLKSWVDDLR